MVKVRIFQPAKTAMQSGRRNTKRWVIEFEPNSQKKIDPLMGWVSSEDTRGQVRVYFDTKDDAINTIEFKDRYIIVPQNIIKYKNKKYSIFNKNGQSVPKNFEYSSDKNDQWLDEDTIGSLLKL